MSAEEEEERAANEATFRETNERIREEQAELELSRDAAETNPREEGA